NGVSPTPQDVIDMITVNAARSVGAAAEIGALRPGMKADLTILDLNTPAMRPIIRLLSNIAHYGHPGIVHSVIVDGEFIMRDRKHNRQRDTMQRYVPSPARMPGIADAIVSGAIRIGERVFLSGANALQKDGRVAGLGDPASQANATLDRLEEALSAAGGSLAS